MHAAQVAREEVAEDRAPREVALDDLVAERAQQVGRALQRAELLGVGARRHHRRDVAGDRDPQLAGLALRRVGERLAAVADRVVEARAVGHAARDRAPRREPVPRLDERRGRHAAALRLEPEQPAAARGDADRAAAVGAERRRAQPGRDRRRGAAAGPARGALQVPRVARDPERRRLGERHDHHLGHVGLAEDHGAGAAQPPHDLGVRRRRLVADRAGAHRRGLPLDVGVVLDRQRDAEQRARVAAAPARVGLGGLGERHLVRHHPEGVEHRVVRGDPVEEQLGELAGADLAAVEHGGVRGESGECDIGHGGRGGYWPCCTACPPGRRSSD